MRKTRKTVPFKGRKCLDGLWTNGPSDEYVDPRDENPTSV